MLKITVGIPFHNAPDCVIRSAHAAASNCREIGADFQLILMDDYSDPDPVIKIQAGIRDIPEAIVLSTFSKYKHNPNLGLSINNLLDMVRPDDDYYWHVESDVYPEPGCLHELIKGIEDVNNMRVSAVRGSLLSMDGLVNHGSRTGDWDPETNRFTCDRKTTWHHLCCLLVRGEHARDKRIRVEEDAYRFWFADLDYGCALTYYSGQESLTIYEAHYKHDVGKSHQLFDGHPWHWQYKEMPGGAMTWTDAGIYSEKKWKDRWPGTTTITGFWFPGVNC